MKERVVGIVLVTLGLFFGYVGANLPLSDAAAHKDSVTLYMKAILACPPTLVLGIIYLMLGPNANELLGRQGARTPLFWILLVVTLGAGFGAYFWIQSTLQAAGYRF